MVLNDGMCSTVYAIRIKLIMFSSDLSPAHLRYEECDCLTLKPTINVELVILSVTNTHTIMVLPKVSQVFLI